MTAPSRISGRTIAERQRMCENKVRYSDALTARAGGLINMEHPLSTVRKLYHYKCAICRGHHLTKRKQPGQEPIMLEQVQEPMAA